MATENTTANPDTPQAPEAEAKADAKATRATKAKTTRRTTKRAATTTANPFDTKGDPALFGRINIIGPTPEHEAGLFPARVELGEPFQVTAHVFIEGRAKVGATAVLRNHRGTIKATQTMTAANPGLDYFTATLAAGENNGALPWEKDFAATKRQLGEWTVTIEGWEDVYTTWLHDARIKVRINDDVPNALAAGEHLLKQWARSKDAGLKGDDKKAVQHAAEVIADTTLSPDARLAGADNPQIAALHASNPLRVGVSASRPLRFKVERPKSTFAAWYQFFPRSEGSYVDPDTGKIVQGTFATAVSGLERAKAEGFDIVYLPPIFPIGVTNRKGKDNTLVAGPDDPGSPFGIGSELGGHDTVDPLLGTMDDFKAFVAKAHELGLEIALDFALQCSPDHPWVTQHPNWFRHKPDGTIAFAENPPKKYQDIYPIDFEEDLHGIEREVERVMNLWIDAGVTIFRVDNPHTKPVRFWQDVIAAVTKKHPEVLFLAEAFTRPSMMRALSYVGFTQSHCYFPWRNTKEELAKYLAETNSDEAYYQHNTFWPTTPDILTAYVRDNGIAGHCVRAVLAALGSPSWGIYNGFELVENKQRPGFEEQRDNEKYEIKVRDWSKAKEYGIAELLTTLNKVRAEHPATHTYHNLTVLESSDDNILAFVRHTPGEFTADGKPDTLIVVVNLDGHNAHQAMVHVEKSELGLPADAPFEVRDELTGREFTWDWDNFVSLAPWADVAHVLSVKY